MRDPSHDALREGLHLATARVRDAVLRRPFVVDGSLDLVAACRQMQAEGLTHALVRDGARLGIFTTTDLRDALLRDVPPAQLAVREVARFDLVEINADAELFEALWLMVRHRVHRLIVRDGRGPGAPVLGVLGHLDVVSLVAHPAHVAALQIDEATTIDALHAAAARIDELVRALHATGTRIDRLARLASELNTRLVARLWALVAPAPVREVSALVVLGSEGRGEQILRTDQDNALLLRDGADAASVGVAARLFTAGMGRLGWPPCPGGVMLSTPLWCQTLGTWRETMRGWVFGAQSDGPMHLAIFLDARVVAGDATLLASARDHLDTLVVGQTAFFTRFAAAADQFPESPGWLARLTQRQDEEVLDLKKLGTFPIVHGARALALQHGLRETATEDRLVALVARGVLEEALARDLHDALQLFTALRLGRQLRDAAVTSNELFPAELSTLQREALRDALTIVRRFRGWLRQHFGFD